MRKNNLLLTAAFVGMVFLVGCNKYIAPAFTSVDKITQLKPGMKLKQITDILEIEPYDIFHTEQNNNSVLSFNYRLKKRVMKVASLNRDEVERKTTNVESQTGGTVFYDKKYQTLFVMLKNGELASMITTSGREDSEFLLVGQNNLKFIEDKNVNNYDSTYYKLKLIDLRFQSIKRHPWWMFWN